MISTKYFGLFLQGWGDSPKLAMDQKMEQILHSNGNKLLRMLPRLRSFFHHWFVSKIYNLSSYVG